MNSLHLLTNSVCTASSLFYFIKMFNQMFLSPPSPSPQDGFLLQPSEKDERAAQDGAERDDDTNNHQQAAKVEKVPRKMLSRGARGSGKRFSTRHALPEKPSSQRRMPDNYTLVPLAMYPTSLDTHTHTLSSSPTGWRCERSSPHFSFSFKRFVHYGVDNWRRARCSASNYNDLILYSPDGPHTMTLQAKTRLDTYELWQMW